MKLGAVLMGGGPPGGRGGFGEGGRGRSEAPGGEERPRRTAPRDPEAGFKGLGRFGIRNVVARAQIADGRLYATVDELKKLTDTAAKYDVSVDILDPPFLPSSHIDREQHPAIMLGQSPERDRDIEQIQTMIKNCAAAKIPCIKYNMSILGVLRTGRTPGRGDTSYSTYRLKDAKQDVPLTRAGVVNADRYWERITYFLERVIPVANEYKIRMACHPNDSPVPPQGYQGVDAVLGTVEGLKKFIAIQESPYHGLNFCQGSVSEMLANPGKEILDVIRYFGTRKKIFNVHFRNIKGRRDDFMEVAPDEGDVNMYQAMRAYKEVGFEYMIHPDHAVFSPSDSGGEYTAFVYGYIRALIQAVDQAG
ncbi:MAG: mannonate dehydratase [Acidobacteria bacterium]|nr:mannonate dehydratase [Acidobacteriota bacterium]